MSALDELREELRDTALRLERMAELLQDRCAALESELDNLRRDLAHRP